MRRREFIKNGSLATAGLTIINFPIYGKMAPSNKVVLAVMGVNSRGAYLAKSFSQLPGVEVAYICDVEEKAIRNGLDALKDASRPPVVVRDIRKLVEQKDFDALVIAAPDHWHAPAAILGASHGKHVYVEKPCGQNPYEGELLAAAYHKYKRHIQMGSQRRSFPSLIDAVAQVKAGIIGNAYFARAWYANNRKSIGYGKVVPGRGGGGGVGGGGGARRPANRAPPTLDFELWQGPAPRKDYRDNLVHYNWHWFWHWGTGEACNNGTHEIDCCRWFLGLNYPTKVVSAGGRYAFKDDWQTPDTQTASFEFAEGKSISWEGRSCNHFPGEGSDRGFVIYGDGGTLVNLGGGDYKIFDEKNKLVKEVRSEVVADPTNPVSASGNMDLYHFGNFINTIRGEAALTAPVDESCKSVLLCHLANIAQRGSGVLHCDPANGHILNDDAAAALWRRTYEKGWEPVV